ncbi:LPXTG cell wall anchor domain-containing protein [Sphingobacterium sp. lm-10]|uniref:LPXTG cell wall anchor domain-containing protein n=1 Tax=Sphingobacterium sp. lm-10 TaxID=2944904 RepID=UPI00202112E6|nr:LPXTG cell wall anchor domain-containing protein [Sphingobacterium sp. lm-10]MCL7986480.1 LPXTG cell wall anchor domain-containing protein [Sphingobacterium sp. lm-10]
MNVKSIISAIILATVIIVLFFNREEATFWLFGTIHTSKLIILGIFFLLGMIAGGFLFRRRKKKEYSVSNFHNTDSDLNDTTPIAPTSNLSDADRDYLRRD